MTVRDKSKKRNDVWGKESKKFPWLLFVVYLPDWLALFHSKPQGDFRASKTPLVKMDPTCSPIMSHTFARWAGGAFSKFGFCPSP